MRLTEANCSLYDAHHPTLAVQRAYCHHYRGFLLEFLGRPDDAASAYTTAMAFDQTERDARPWILLAAADAARMRHRDEEARAIYQHILEADGRSEHWFVRLRANHARLGLGLLPGTARHVLEECAAVYEAATGSNEEREPRWRLQVAQRALAASM